MKIINTEICNEDLICPFCGNAEYDELGELEDSGKHNCSNCDNDYLYTKVISYKTKKV